jgi:hypothetical protein
MSLVGYNRASASCLIFYNIYFTISIIICAAVLGQVLIIKIKFSREACVM